jgi:hypothetical protein
LESRLARGMLFIVRPKAAIIGFAKSVALEFAEGNQN